jgi:NAD(P)-dependent dehydrogenase (short-subunit alcohol dehydrogenase family)
VVEPYGGAASYLASKGALLALTQALDCEYSPAGVRGHCIVAGPMREGDGSAPGDEASVGYGTVVDAICRLVENPQAGVSYLPAANGGGRRP